MSAPKPKLPDAGWIDVFVFKRKSGDVFICDSLEDATKKRLELELEDTYAKMLYHTNNGQPLLWSPKSGTIISLVDGQTGSEGTVGMMVYGMH